MAASMSRPGSRLLFVALTVLYLVAELAFNARLLDVAGSLSTDAEVHALERIGKTLSGLAAALLLAKWISAKWSTGALRALLAASPLVPLVFWGQGALIDHLVSRASNVERQMATYAALVPSAVINRQANLAGLDLDPKEFASPAAKTFFALFPALAYSSPEVIKSIDRQLEGILRMRAIGAVGSPEEFYNKRFIDVVNETKEAYNNKYVPASNKTVGADSGEAAWEDYLETLAKNNIDPRSPHPFKASYVRSNLRQRGILVPNDFMLSDKDTFLQAYVKMNEGRPSYAGNFPEEASSALGYKTTMQPGLNWTQFAAHPDVQKKVASQLKERLPDAVIPSQVNVNWTPEEVERKLHRPMVDSLVNKTLKQFRSKADSFGKDGPYGKQAETALRAVLVPPLALFFSLFFSVFNLLGLLAGGAAWAISARGKGGQLNIWLARGLRVALFAAVVWVPLQLTNPVSESGAFRTLVTKIQNGGGTPLAMYLTWVIKAEPAAYPFARFLKDRVPFEGWAL